MLTAESRAKGQQPQAVPVGGLLVQVQLQILEADAAIFEAALAPQALIPVPHWGSALSNIG